MKPENIQVADKNYFAWNYEEQTKIKHLVLKEYGRIWLTKLGSMSNTMFFDCHGGCGAYISNNEISLGSSFIIDKLAEEINCRRTYNNTTCTCEIEKEYFDNFNKILLDVGSHRIALKNMDFNNAINDTKIKKYYTSNPTLFFVDPFGYDLCMNNLSSLMGPFGNEIIVNFMFDWINRFVSKPSLEKNLDNFFGSHDWIKAIDLSGIEREKCLVDLYKQELKKTTKARFVFAYRICYPDRDRTYYYLVHATNHIDGITHMKDSFAHINNGRVEYLGKKNNLISLFDFTEYKASEMVNGVLTPYKGKKITFTKLWEEIVEETSYTNKDLCEIIVELEKEERLKVQRVTSKRMSYKGEDLITFGEK